MGWHRGIAGGYAVRAVSVAAVAGRGGMGDVCEAEDTVRERSRH